MERSLALSILQLNERHTATMEALIAAEASTGVVSINEGTPMHIAANQGHTATLEALIAADASTKAVDSDGRTPMHTAACQSHTATVEVLIAARAKTETIYITIMTRPPLYF